MKPDPSDRSASYPQGESRNPPRITITAQTLPDSDLPTESCSNAQSRPAAAHPLCAEAIAFPYCEPLVMVEPKRVIDGFRFSDDAKAAIRKSLEDVDRVVYASFWTSERQPQSLSGGGKTFDFILHPESLAVLHTASGTWRS